MSGAIFRTDLSWPAVVAFELGDFAAFRRPVYEAPSGPGGLPLDFERALRSFESEFGPKLDWHEIVRAAGWLHGYLDRVEDYWERGDGRQDADGRSDPPQPGDLRLGSPRHAVAQCDKRARAVGAAAGRRVVAQAEGAGRQRPGRARGARDRPWARQARAHHASSCARPRRRGHGCVRHRTGDRDPGRAARLEQRSSSRHPARGALERRRLRRSRPEGRVQRLAAGALRGRMGTARRRASPDQGASRDRGNRSFGDDRADCERRARQGAARLALLPLLHAPVDSGRGLRSELRPASHRGRGARGRLRRRRLQQDDHRLRRGGARGRARLVSVRPRRVPRPACVEALSD